MNELDLYRFIEENNIEIDWRGDSLVIWVGFDQLQDFTELIKLSHIDTGSIEVTLQEAYIALDIVELCNYNGINPERILAKEIEE